LAFHPAENEEGLNLALGGPQVCCDHFSVMTAARLSRDQIAPQ
jgi:hypothetical protein